MDDSKILTVIGTRFDEKVGGVGIWFPIVLTGSCFISHFHTKSLPLNFAEF